LWFAIRSYIRMRGRRLVLLGCSLLLIWFLFTHRLSDLLQSDSWEPQGGIIIPSTSGRDTNKEFARLRPNGVPGKRPADSTIPTRPDPVRTQNGEPPQANSHRNKQPSKDKFATKYYYEGEMNFYELPSSMQSLNRFGGSRIRNQYILFSASSLQSAAVLIPMACEITRRGNNYVHMAFMGRNDLSIQEILEANGVDRSCEVIFHDARPDYAMYSSDTRAEESVINALKYIQEYMHPQVLITHSPLVEDDFFTRAMGDGAKEYGIPLIQIPYQEPKLNSRPQDNLAWITRLDAPALGAWHIPDIEIVIQVRTAMSGKVKRLLESLWSADYAGTTPPRLTIELPTEADEDLVRNLAKFQWPPSKTPGEKSQINIRRRIKIHSMTPEEASVRFMESFFPTEPDRSHVLILSPNTVVSPFYYQQLRYYLLQLKHNRLAALYPPMMGIALNLPGFHLNGSEVFSAPDLSAIDIGTKAESKPVSNNARPHFLWQAPNTDAALYFGSAWVEMHSFVSYRLTKFHSERNGVPRKKLVGDHMPAWSELALEFMRCRGYSFFYPGSPSANDAAVTSTSGPDDKPEEFRAYHSQIKKDVPSATAEEPPQIFPEPFLPPKDSLRKPENSLPPYKPSSSITSPLAQQPLVNILAFSGPEPSLFLLPHLTWDGTLSNPDDLAVRASGDSEKFRQELGGCRDVKTPPGKQRKVVNGSARDLFCFGDDTWEDAPILYQSPNVIPNSKIVKPAASSEESSYIERVNPQKPQKDQQQVPKAQARIVEFDHGPVYN